MMDAVSEATNIACLDRTVSLSSYLIDFTWFWLCCVGVLAGGESVELP
jgi:hypothetical protein